MRKRIDQAMNDPERWVVQCDYTGKDGKRTRRVISPVRWMGADRILALCLCREEPRLFYFARMRHIELIPAESVMMPEPIVEIATERNEGERNGSGDGGNRHGMADH